MTLARVVIPRGSDEAARFEYADGDLVFISKGCTFTTRDSCDNILGAATSNAKVPVMVLTMKTGDRRDNARRFVRVYVPSIAAFAEMRVDWIVTEASCESEHASSI